jgi:hypothetical protein
MLGMLLFLELLSRVFRAIDNSGRRRNGGAMDMIELDVLASRHPEIPEAVVQSARQLLEALTKAPDSVSRGHNPTICFYWSVGDVEVEVTSTDFEFYGPGPNVDIRHFPHKDPVPSELLELLPR